MKKVRCLIVDDEPMARKILDGFLAKIDSLEVVGTCRNAIEAFNYIASNKIDLVFLDVNMPEISGLSFAKSINKEIKIIFTTAHREYAVDGFDLQAVDYLLKPISFERLQQAVYKYLGVVKEIAEQKPIEQVNVKVDFFFVKSDRKMIKINFTEICFVESLSDYIKIVLPGKTVVTRETISSIEARLPYEMFMRCHRSFIVSVDKIESFTSEFVEVSKVAISISRSYRKDVLSRLESI